MDEKLAKVEVYFKGYENEYCVIGGLANYYWMQDHNEVTRATKDFDIVVFGTNVSDGFIEQIRNIIKDGEYEEKSDGDNLFRFVKPRISGFPDIIEIFSTSEKMNEAYASHTIKLSYDKCDFSAIYIDPIYMEVVKQFSYDRNGVSMLNNVGLIILKAHAFLRNYELYHSDTKGVKSNNYKKHAKDVIRLLSAYRGNNDLIVDAIVKSDLIKFSNHDYFKEMDYSPFYIENENDIKEIISDIFQ